MTSVSCWCNDCRWELNGWCNRGVITISEDYECECYESYSEEYKESFYKACIEDGEKYRKLATNGKKIEYKGYLFYTQDKITDSGNYFLTEARTGVGICTFHELEKRWDKFLERIDTYPDVTTYPIKESEVAKRREDIENSPADCSTPSVTDSKGERNEQRKARLRNDSCI